MSFAFIFQCFLKCYLFSYFSSHHEARKAVTVSHQPALSCAASLTSAQLDHLFKERKFSFIRFRFVLQSQ